MQTTSQLSKENMILSHTVEYPKYQKVSKIIEYREFPIHSFIHSSVYQKLKVTRVQRSQILIPICIRQQKQVVRIRYYLFGCYLQTGMV